MIILKNRGERMRKLIILLVLTAFIVTLSSPILYAAEWDSATGPNWVDQAYVDRADLSGDDGGWGDPQKSSGNGLYNRPIYSNVFFEYIKSFFYIFIIDNNSNNEEHDSTDYREVTNSSGSN